MDNNELKASSNWSQISGCEFLQSLQVKAANADFFQRPNLNELINEEKSILLSKGRSSEHCEIYVQIFPRHKIQAVSFACNVSKVEIFQGPIREYFKTIYGIIIDESDDQFKTYRYDVEIEKSGVTDLTLKFLTNFEDVCIFGVILHTAPNPNGITTLLPNSSCISIPKVQSLLQNTSTQLGPTFEWSKLIPKPNQSNSLDRIVKSNINLSEKGESTFHNDTANEAFLNQLKLHIDDRFQEMEMRINKHLECMEKRQMEKLDNILTNLEQLKK